MLSFQHSLRFFWLLSSTHHQKNILQLHSRLSLHLFDQTSLIDLGPNSLNFSHTPWSLFWSFHLPLKNTLISQPKLYRFSSSQTRFLHFRTVAFRSREGFRHRTIISFSINKTIQRFNFSIFSLLGRFAGLSTAILSISELFSQSSSTKPSLRRVLGSQSPYIRRFVVFHQNSKAYCYLASSRRNTTKRFSGGTS